MTPAGVPILARHPLWEQRPSEQTAGKTKAPRPFRRGAFGAFKRRLVRVYNPAHEDTKVEDRLDDFTGRLIGNRYMFNASPLCPVVVVAVAGGGNDWAAYIAGLQTYSEPQPAFLQRVYREGYKLTADQAREFFPSIELRYRE